MKKSYGSVYFINFPNTTFIHHSRNGGNQSFVKDGETDPFENLD
jgi:hypothetical protein